MIKKYNRQSLVRKRHIYLLNYFNKKIFIRLPYSRKYIIRIIEWLLFKSECCRNKDDDHTLTLEQIVQLLIKYYGGLKVPMLKRKSGRKYKNVCFIDREFISFFYFDKTRRHYDMTLYRAGIYMDIKNL